MTHHAPDLTTVVTLAGFGLTLAALALSAARGRRLRADLDGAIRRLDALAGRLSALESQGGGAPPIHRPLPPAAPSPTPPAVCRVDRAGPPAGTSPTLITIPDLSAAAGHSSAPGVASELGHRYSTIWEMADRGTPAEAIARDTSQPIGQVELILGLRRPRPDPGRPRPS
ncbi:MAG: hypothetical protein LC745_00965 [Planctomycetia bacterium]|nr:hypothetical protein [Planctomycetia bacterium]